jgi:hypothetical protein
VDNASLEWKVRLRISGTYWRETLFCEWLPSIPMVMLMPLMVLCRYQKSNRGWWNKTIVLVSQFKLLRRKKKHNRNSVVNSSKYHQTHCAYWKNNYCFYLKPKRILLKPRLFCWIPEICKHSYFVNAKSFNINDNIVEHILTFTLRRLVDWRHV